MRKATKNDKAHILACIDAGADAVANAHGKGIERWSAELLTYDFDVVDSMFFQAMHGVGDERLRDALPFTIEAFRLFHLVRVRRLGLED